MKNTKDMIKWINNLKSDIGQPQHSQLWHYAEILDVIAKYLESTERTGEWIYAKEQLEIVPMWECSCCRIRMPKKLNFCPNCGADMRGTKNE